MKFTTRVSVLIVLTALIPICALAGIKQGEGLWLPEALQTISTSLYRICFMLKVPFEVMLAFALPTEGHHGNPTRTVLASLLGGLLLSAALATGYWLIARERSINKEASPQLSRRRFLAGTLMGAAATMLGGTAAYAMLVAPHRLRVRQYDVAIRDLPVSLKGLRIVHVSDTHYGPFMPMHFIKRVIREVNDLEADFVVLTGDYVHKTPRAIPGGIGVLRELKPRLGVVAVLGNHDYWEGVDACREAFRETGIRLLENTSILLGADGLDDRSDFTEQICIAGVVDLWEDQPDVHVAKQGVPESVPTLLLSHNPDYAEIAAPGTRVDLMLSGHTHGGQVRVPGWGTPIVPSRYGQKYSGGWVNGPHWPVIVSRGVGMAALPVRFRVPPEVSIITLRTEA